MENSVIVPNPNPSRETPYPHSDESEAARFLGRYPARVRRIQTRVEDERALLTLALATFQAELATATA